MLVYEVKTSRLVYKVKKRDHLDILILIYLTNQSNHRHIMACCISVYKGESLA